MKMRTLRLVAFFLGICFWGLSHAQQSASTAERYVIAYRTEIPTAIGKITGVLEQVTDSNVVVRNDLNGYDYIPVFFLATRYLSRAVRFAFIRDGNPLLGAERGKLLFRLYIEAR